MASTSYSIVELFPEREKSKCGYCKSPNTNCSNGMWAHSLTVQDYQGLIDRGWRRSGLYCYKPVLDKTCCPMYTIKCEALHFKITKSQKKILKKMTKFLRNELNKDDVMDTNEDRRGAIDVNIGQIPSQAKQHMNARRNAAKMNVSSVDNEVNDRLRFNGSVEATKNSGSKSPQSNSESITSVSSRVQDERIVPQSTKTLDDNSPRVPCKKAKLLRIERKQKKLLAQGKTAKEIEAIFKERKQQSSVKSLDELFDEMYSGTNKLEMKLVRVMSAEFFDTIEHSANLYKKYQMAVHGDSPEECNHESFFNYLGKSPLEHWMPDDGPPKGYGSFHEQYWLNNELIAVGVIDILPLCISSVYFFYDPAYSYLSLGTFSSLREVYLTRLLNTVASDLKYYYMGFYIHTCPKMRYKARMEPSKLLCPETYKWFDIEPCLLKLNKEKYSRLNDDIDAIDEDGIVDINKIFVLYKGVAMPYKIYKVQVKRKITRKEEEDVKHYATLVGMKRAQSLLLYRAERASKS